jgi:hypothetical protein
MCVIGKIAVFKYFSCICFHNDSSLLQLPKLLTCALLIIMVATHGNQTEQRVLVCSYHGNRL